jgi:hypothetical protein
MQQSTNKVNPALKKCSFLPELWRLHVCYTVCRAHVPLGDISVWLCRGGSRHTNSVRAASRAAGVMNELLPGTAGYNRLHQQTLSHVPERYADKAQKAGGV